MKRRSTKNKSFSVVAVAVLFMSVFCVGTLATIATDTTTTTRQQADTTILDTSGGATLASSSSKTPPPIETTSLIVCAVDGSVYTVDAFSGELKSHFVTDKPLVTAKGAEDWEERIVPGLDGRLYALKAGPELKPLPLTVMDILSNPVRTCRDGGQDCGVVTGIKTTSLYGFDPATGILQWKEADGETKRARGHSRDNVSVVLQREDFIVRHVSALDGEELWDVSVGKYIALDFSGPALSSSSSTIQPSHGQKLLPGRPEKESVPAPDDNDLPTIAFDKIGNSVVAINQTTGNVLWKRKMSSVIASVYGVRQDGWAELRVLNDDEFEATIKKAMDSTKKTVASLPAAKSQEPGLVLSNRARMQQEEGSEFMKSFLNGHMPSYVRFNTAEQDKGGALVLYEPPNVEGMLQWKTKLNKHESTMFVRTPSFRSDDESCVLSADGLCESDSGSFLDIDRDFGYAGQKLLPPARGGPSTINLRGTPSQNSGGLFLSWSVVMAIVLFMVATVVALRVLYLQKRHKWVSLAQTPPLLPTNPNSREDEHDDKARFTLGDGSPSDIHAHSDHHSDYLGTLLSTSSSAKRQNKKKMMRSMSMPMLHDDHDGDDLMQLTVWDPSSAKELDKVDAGPPLKVGKNATRVTSGTAAVTSQATTPVPAPPPSVETTSPGLIDGVPLVRYSRYRSEFREESALGKGGFGTVFQCINALDGTKYAVKKVRIKSQTDASGNLVKAFSRRLQRVLREVKILALLDHKNIVRYYAAWLEIEEEGMGGDDASMVEYGTTTDKKLHRVFSSEFLAGTAGAPASDTQSLLTSGFRSRRVKSKKKYALSTNPLGTNINLFENEESLELSRRRKSLNESDDIGFTFERSGSDVASKKTESSNATSTEKITQMVRGDDGSDSSTSSSDASVSSGERESSAWPSEDPTPTKTNAVSDSEKETASKIKASDGEDRDARNLPVSQVTHTLYIQMQLCSQKSLSDFLVNKDARRKGTTSSYGVDIPYALGLFKQIVAGVKHVHQQGLIHRDLKPSNAFIDEAGVVKVGDFGLSRESAAGIMKDGIEDSDTAADSFHSPLGGDDDNTAGVGTRSYASPEQMSGSDYDASTDIYSLGIMLFELCYPMYTGMERHIMFDGIRKGIFPDAWKEYVAVAFPSLHSLVVAMLSVKPEQRPSADDVAKQIDTLLGEYTVLSLDLSRHSMDDFILLRVEALAKEGVLIRTQQLIMNAATGVKILEYGLRGQEAKAIMEFAVTITEDPEGDTVTNQSEDSVELIMRSLQASDEISVARQVSYRRNI